MLNNPIAWWSLFAICMYISDCIIKYSPPMKKWRAGGEDSTPPPWAVITQKLSLTFPAIVLAPTGIVSIFWLFNEEQLFPIVPISNFWLTVIFIAGIISFTKHMIQHTTWENAKLLSKHLKKDARLYIREQCEEEIRERNIWIRESHMLDSTSHHEKARREAKRILQIIAK